MSVIGKSHYIKGVWYDVPRGTPCSLRVLAEQDRLAIDGTHISFVTIRGLVFDKGGEVEHRFHELGMTRAQAAELHAFLTAYLDETAAEGA